MDNMHLISIEELDKQRQAVVQQLLEIRSMLRGTINEQYVQRERPGEEPALYGPYFVLSRREGSKTRSVRLTTPALVEQARKDIANHERFKVLCSELESLTERMGQLERNQQAENEAVKKKPKPRPNRARN